MTTPVQGHWLSDAELEQFEHDPDFVAEGMALRFAEEALGLMGAQGLSRTELAERMSVSKAYVSKLFNAPPNLTLRTIAQVALALGATVELKMSVPLAKTEPAPGTEMRELLGALRQIGEMAANATPDLAVPTAVLPGRYVWALSHADHQFTPMTASWRGLTASTPTIATSDRPALPQKDYQSYARAS